MRVLLAVDDSRYSEAATRAAMAQCSPQKTDFLVMNVVDLKLPIPTLYADDFRQESLRYGKEVVARTEQELSKAGFKAQAVVEEGDPTQKIIDRAAAWKADLIVMGSHGRKGIDHFLMGSVSEGVTRYAPCSVEVVRVGKN
jgi:nucleotide-binding universal stress UspA family protein